MDLEKESLSQEKIDRGIRFLIIEGSCSSLMGILTGGAFLVAFALYLGASNTTIGLLAAIGPCTQALQIPAIMLVEKLGRRKPIVICLHFIARITWLFVAVIPFFVSDLNKVFCLIIALFFHFSVGNISSCAYNSWMRDFLPDHKRAESLAKRMVIYTTIGVIGSLCSGWAFDYFKSISVDEKYIFLSFYSISSILGCIGVYSLSKIPEPKMALNRGKSILSSLTIPFKNNNFKRQLSFLGWWNFSINLAAPFFAVYLLKNLRLPMSHVILLSVLSQLMHIAFIRIWGMFADKFTNKSVLSIAGPMFLFSIILWPFCTLPDKHFLTYPILILIHILSGVSTAGVTIGTGNIAVKLSPRGEATSYLAVNALVAGLFSSIAPLLTGLMSDTLSFYEFSVEISWKAIEEQNSLFNIHALNFRSLDFVFGISFILGLYAIKKLSRIIEEGEVEEEVVIKELYSEMTRTVRHVSNVSGLRHLTYFPFYMLRKFNK